MGRRVRGTGKLAGVGEPSARLRPVGSGEKVGRRKPAKYRNKKVEFDGHKFDSIKEYERYCELSALERAGHISGLEVHPRFKLTASGRPVKYASGRQASYTADFRYTLDGERIVEDTKGYDTDASKLRRAVLQAETGITVTVI